eukprot:4388867-Amphidinium_carterae.1
MNKHQKSLCVFLVLENHKSLQPRRSRTWHLVFHRMHTRLNAQDCDGHMSHGNPGDTMELGGSTSR